MPAALNSRRDASIVEGLRGLLDIGAGTLRGGAAATLGAPGDIEALVRALKGSKDPNVFPTTERMLEKLPTTGADTATFEKVGEYGNPLTPAKKALAIGKAVPLAATFVPAFLKGARRDEAVSKIMGGASPEELWKGTQIVKAPSTPRGVGSDRRLLEEISDEGARFGSKVPILSEVEKNMLAQQFPLLNVHGAKQRAKQLELPAPGEYRQEDFLHHPELYSKFPELREGKVRVVNDMGSQNRGTYKPKTGDVTLNLSQFLRADDPGGGVIGTNLHEITHKLGQLHDTPKGASGAHFQASPGAWDQLEEVVRRNISNPQFQQEMGPEGMKHLGNLLRYKGAPAFHAYKNSPGEQLARQAQKRMSFTPEMRKDFAPDLHQFYSQPDPEFAFTTLHLMEALAQSPGSLDPTNLPRWLKDAKQLR